ncbi:MAG TPA: SDR family oxidoreductase [Thermoanaerobaculia bacterium]|nr:SDR family oxidoreductase [Thermoanaerobaculia bacterium]
MPTVLVTGANRGLGLGFARAYAARGDRVLGTARRPGEAEALAAVAARVLPLDVTDGASVAALSEAVGDERLDLVVHNAGILVEDRLDDVDPADVLAQLDANAVGPLRVTLAVRGLLARGGKLAVISSVMGSIAENDQGGYYGYRSSKAALNAIVKCLAIDLAPLPVVAVHPGYVRTRMSPAGDVEPDEAAAALVALIDGAGRRETGRFFDRHGREIPW